jgi:hypothetical protein
VVIVWVCGACSAVSMLLLDARTKRVTRPRSRRSRAGRRSFGKRACSVRRASLVFGDALESGLAVPRSCSVEVAIVVIRAVSNWRVDSRVSGSAIW